MPTIEWEYIEELNKLMLIINNLRNNTLQQSLQRRESGVM